MQQNKVIKTVKEMDLAPFIKESKPARPGGADHSPLAKRGNAWGHQQLRCHRAFLRDLQTLD